MIPLFFTVTLYGGRATARINACAISRLSVAAEDGCMIHLAGGDAVRVNQSVPEVEQMVNALRQVPEVVVPVITRQPGQHDSPRHPRGKTA